MLVIQRVANKSALTSGTVAPGHTSEFKVRTPEELTGGGGTVPGRYTASSVDRRGVASGELGTEITIDLHQDRV